MNVLPRAPFALTALAASLVLACTPAADPNAAAAPASPVAGAWSVASLSVTDSAGTATLAIQPSLYIFGDRHYSMMRVTGEGPRTLSATDSVTDVERLAAYNTFIANSGTYEISDSTLTIHPVVARSPNFMSGGSDRYTFRVSGDTLWLSNTSSDMRTMIGGQLVAPSGPPSSAVQVLVRQR